jgi:hypothetical protein
VISSHWRDPDQSGRAVVNKERSPPSLVRRQMITTLSSICQLINPVDLLIDIGSATAVSCLAEAQGI